MKTEKLQVRCKRKLHDICTTFAPSFPKNEGGNGRVAKGASKYPPKNAMEIQSLHFNILSNLENAVEI